MSLAWVHTDGYMPERKGLFFSAGLHVAVIVAIILGLPQLFQRKVEDEPVIAVELINLAPKTLATQRNPTPTPQKPPEVVEQPPPPKPTPPTPPEAKPAPAPPEVKPPPPPEPKPAEVKPPEPKPAPVVEAKPQPPQPPQPKPKPKDSNFDQMLKNLAAKAPAQPQTPTQQVAKAQPSSQPNAPLGSQLSTSEVDLVKQQLIPCWNFNPGSRDASTMTPEFRVTMNPDGTVRSAQLLNSDRMSDPFFRSAAETAQRALRNPQCQPLKFPPQKYDQWQTFTITFDPKDLS